MNTANELLTLDVMRLTLAAMCNEVAKNATASRSLPAFVIQDIQSLGKQCKSRTQNQPFASLHADTQARSFLWANTGLLYHIASTLIHIPPRYVDLAEEKLSQALTDLLDIIQAENS